jgi:hypothetical protein
MVIFSAVLTDDFPSLCLKHVGVTDIRKPVVACWLFAEYILTLLWWAFLSISLLIGIGFM